MNHRNDTETAREAVAQINPSMLDYDEWLAVGMAMKDAGCSADEWDRWSARDSKRHKPGETARKWASFKNLGSGSVGIGTLVKLCQDQGGTVARHHPDIIGRALAWDDTIGPAGHDPERVVDPDWIEDAETLTRPAKWDGRKDFIRYLQSVFDTEDKVGIVADAWQGEDGRWLPKRGVSDRSAGELIQALAKADDLGAVIGDWQPDAGAWIRFNPLDGQGCRDTNVTRFRHALVESDEISIERQLAIYKALELPCSAIVHSGGKSIHAIVRVDAADFPEYQKRVDFLYEICKKNGLAVDRKNKNPSRLSRLPGVTRKGAAQWLVATNCGLPSWAEWVDHVVAVNDDLPDFETLSDFIHNPPPLAETLIDGVLRKGHKMLLAGPSKAGKSYLMLQLAVALAEGGDWLGWRCARGRVLYINLELDRASCYHRLAAVYKAKRIPPEHAEDIDLWNLRGKSMPMNELAPKLIRRAMKRRYAAIIIDPIYKVITGDENAAHEMAKFCNQFDRLCHELGAAVIYCHHHSKGEQGQKRAHDRASGSGVFARDPDALLDCIQLAVSDPTRSTISNRWQCEAIARALDAVSVTWRDQCPQDDQIVADRLAKWCAANGHGDSMRDARPDAIKAAETTSAWRIEGILREFPSFDARHLWFRHPDHINDNDGLLKSARAEGEMRPPKEAGEAKAENTRAETIQAVEAVRDMAGNVFLKELAAFLNVSIRTVKDRVKAAGMDHDKVLVTPSKTRADN